MKWDHSGYLLEAKVLWLAVNITKVIPKRTQTTSHNKVHVQYKSFLWFFQAAFKILIQEPTSNYLKGKDLWSYLSDKSLKKWKSTHRVTVMRALSQMLMAGESTFHNAPSHKCCWGRAVFSGTETSAAEACCSCLSSKIASLFLPRELDGFGSSTIERDTVLIALEGSKAFELWLWVIFCYKTCVSTWLVNSSAGLYGMLGPSIWKTTLHPNLTSVFYHAVRLTGHSVREASFWDRQSREKYCTVKEY